MCGTDEGKCETGVLTCFDGELICAAKSTSPRIEGHRIWGGTFGTWY